MFKTLALGFLMAVLAIVGSTSAVAQTKTTESKSKPATQETTKKPAEKKSTIQEPAKQVDSKSEKTITHTAAKFEMLTLNVQGVDTADCAKLISKTLTDAGLKEVSDIKPDAKAPVSLHAMAPVEGDLGAIAAKVNKAETKNHKTSPPALYLELFSKLDAKSTESCLAACKKIDGVDAKGCKCDSAAGTIMLKISGDKKVTVPQIISALKQAGVTAQVAKLDSKKS